MDKRRILHLALFEMLKKKGEKLFENCLCVCSSLKQLFHRTKAAMITLNLASPLLSSVHTVIF